MSDTTLHMGPRLDHKPDALAFNKLVEFLALTDELIAAKAAPPATNDDGQPSTVMSSLIRDLESRIDSKRRTLVLLGFTPGMLDYLAYERE